MWGDISAHSDCQCWCPVFKHYSKSYTLCTIECKTDELPPLWVKQKGKAASGQN